MATYKKTKFDKTNVSLGELADWSDKNSTLPGPELPDERFVIVVNYEIFEVDDNKPDSYEDGDMFRFFITTRRLIEFSSNFRTLKHTDGTYKFRVTCFIIRIVRRK